MTIKGDITMWKRRIRLGDLLVEQEVITPEQLEQALKEQENTRNKLGKVLIDGNYVKEDYLLNILADQLGISFIDLRHYKFDPEVVRQIPEMYARRFRAIALGTFRDAVLIGMADPTDIFAYDELTRILQKPIKLAVVRETDVLRTIDNVYRRTDDISNFAEELGEELSEHDYDLLQLATNEDLKDAPVVKLLQSLFEDAIQVQASDIHIEPDEYVLRIRQRIDNLLHEQVMKERHIASALVLRLKIMAGLNISEKRLPQDGRFSLKIRGKTIDVRLSTLPTQYGESVVMRLLNSSHGQYTLDQVGMSFDTKERFMRLLKQPNGMILVTGPTGSGKTTTLYAALNLLNHPETKIISVEDPIEYRLPRINQVQVHNEIGLDFARVLRASLRQDPDILLVGEMRDEETVEIGLRAAMTGHLVLSTLHTNDAVSAASRLLDMGAKGYLVASALRGVLAQRLVRKICPSCSEPYTPTTQERMWLSTLSNGNNIPNLRHGVGCVHCHNTGYSGRIGVFELLEINEPLAKALLNGNAHCFAEIAKQQACYQPLGKTALDLALQGVTTLAEAERIGGNLDALLEQDYSFRPEVQLMVA